LVDGELNHSRRNFVLSGGYALAVAAARAGRPVDADGRLSIAGVDAAQSGRPADADAGLSIAAIEAKLGGRIGVAALDTGSGTRLAHRGDDRFAMCSTFKWILAAAVLMRHEKGGGSLEQRLSYGRRDLLAHSPVTEAHLAEGSMPIGELCKAAVETSDNTAANTLLKCIGGPAAFTRFLRSIGDRTTRLDRIEPALNSNTPGDPRDTTTPNAMLATLQTVLVGNALSAGSREMLLTWMKNCQTGLRRLRAGLPPTWTAGDKTGTGERGAVNDNAIVWPPQRAPILIAAYLTDSRASSEVLEGAQARIGRLVVAALS
jgi:beta-lactamase class A